MLLFVIFILSCIDLSFLVSFQWISVVRFFSLKNFQRFHTLNCIVLGFVSIADSYVLLLTLWMVSNTLLCTFRLGVVDRIRIISRTSLEKLLLLKKACCCVYCTILFCHCKILAFIQMEFIHIA